MRSFACVATIASLLLIAFRCAWAGQLQDDELTVVNSRQAIAFAAIRNTPGLLALTFMEYDRDTVVVAQRVVALASSRFRGIDPPLPILPASAHVRPVWGAAPGSNLSSS